MLPTCGRGPRRISWAPNLGGYPPHRRHRQSFQGGNLITRWEQTRRCGCRSIPFRFLQHCPDPDDPPWRFTNLFTAAGVSLTDRRHLITTNNRVVAIETAAGSLNAARAVGRVRRSFPQSPGKVSPSVRITVTPCCQIGEGAPTPIQQAIQDAVTRNRLTIALPAKPHSGSAWATRRSVRPAPRRRAT
jgi:hypothetical protein